MKTNLRNLLIGTIFSGLAATAMAGVGTVGSAGMDVAEIAGIYSSGYLQYDGNISHGRPWDVEKDKQACSISIEALDGFGVATVTDIEYTKNHFSGIKRYDREVLTFLVNDLKSKLRNFSGTGKITLNYKEDQNIGFTHEGRKTIDFYFEDSKLSGVTLKNKIKGDLFSSKTECNLNFSTVQMKPIDR